MPLNLCNHGSATDGLSVLIVYMLPTGNPVAYELRSIQILIVHVHGTYLMVVIGRVVHDALISVVARGLERYLELSGLHLTAAPLLIDTSEDMEELADAFRFPLSRKGVQLHVGYAYEP